MKLDWRHRDWIWVLTCILLLVGSLYINQNEFLSLISYGSTFVSVSLAFVAIYISVREATNADKVKDDISMILGEMKEKLGQLDNKVSNIDIQTINQKIINGIDEGVSKIRESITSEVGNDNKEDVIPYIDRKLQEMSTDLKSSLIVRPQQIKHLNKSNHFLMAERHYENQIIEDHIADIILNSDKNLSLGEINKELFNRKGISTDDNTLRRIIKKYTSHTKAP